jgi:2'-5' RNA ligase
VSNGKKEGRTQKQEIRTFICIAIPPSIRDRIDALQKKLRSVGADVSWVKTSNIHLTLKFLGDVPQPGLVAVYSAVTKICQHFGPITLTVGESGGFPSLRNPRVLWVGLPQLPESLRLLQTRLEEELEREGFPRENRPFSPHLTVARIRSSHNTGPLVEALMREGFAPESFQAQQVIVMRSQLNPGASVYTPLAVIPLAGREPAVLHPQA